MTKNDNLEPGFYAGLILLGLLLFFSVTKCHARGPIVADTIICNQSCITRYVTKSTEKSIHVYAVYIDQKNNIYELIPVSKSVYEYICTCKELGLKPKLGLRLVNGQIASIIRIKTKYKICK